MKHSLQILQGCLRLVLMVLPAGVAAQDMRINGCHVIMNGPVHVVFHNAGLTNNGIFVNGNGTVTFTGDQPSGISGASTTAFNNIVINKMAMQNVILHQDVSIPGTITMRNGKLQLNNRTLNLGQTGGINGESEQSYITGVTGGRVLVTRNLFIPPDAVNPGNIGVELSCPTALGTVTIERNHVQENLYAPGSVSIHRTFTISGGFKAGTQDLNASLRIFYLDAELGGNDELGLNMFTNSDVGNFWSQLGSDGNDNVRNWVLKENLQRLGRFTLGGFGSSSLTNSTNIRSGLKPALISRLQVKPNPAQNSFSLVFYSNSKKNIVLNLYSQQGHLLQTKNVSCEQGMNTVSWDIKNYAAGTYFVTDNSGSIQTKVVKQ